MKPYHRPPFTLKELKIEVTYRCDLNCIHCSSDAKPSSYIEMSLDNCLRILLEASEMGTKEIAFSGGEPLLWPYLFRAVESAFSHQMKVTIYTSGNTEDFKNKASKLHAVGASGFIFSIFGGTAITHERITRKSGSFDCTKNAIEDALSLGLKVELHFVPMSVNYRELPDIALLGKKIGASRISVLRLVPQGRATLIRSRILSRVQNLELRRTIQDLRKEHGNNFIRTGSPYNFLSLNENPACCAAIDRLIIGPDLRLYPCDAFKRIGALELVGSENLSSLIRSSLPDCWSGSPYLNAVRTYLTTEFAEPCDSCKALENCLSGCLAQKAIAYSSLEKKPDPDCLGRDFQGE